MSATLTARLNAYESEVPDRALHFVGSLPPELLGDNRTTMQWFLDHAASTTLLTLPCDRDPRWLIDWLNDLGTVAALQPIRHGDSTDYDKLPAYSIAPGHRLEPDDVSLRRTSDVAAAMAARPRLDTERPLPPHQVSTPNALDLAHFCFDNPLIALAQLPVFRHAVMADVLDIHHRWGSEIVFQLETPAVLILFERTPRRLWPALAYGLAAQTAQLLTGAPPEVRWILHLCHGDLGHKPADKPRDLVPAVQFLNALHRRLNMLNYPMPLAHIPMCTGTTGPPTESLFYRALSHLRTGIDVIAGLTDEQRPEDSRTALQLAERELARPVTAVAAACGHGRRTPTAAAANACLARELTLVQTSGPTG